MDETPVAGGAEWNLREGERRDVTVLFADMKGFTALSERLDPEDIDGIMNQVFARFEGIVVRHDGMVEKYIGDALVAVFGAPRMHEDDPTRAINSALEFLSDVRSLTKSLPIANLSLGFRIGINTGLITTGKRGQFDVVTGHAMSVAARLESEAPVDTVYVSNASRVRSKNDFLFSEPIHLKLRGTSDTIVAYEVKGRNNDPLRDDGAFVGRADVLDSMLKVYLRHSATAVNGFFLSGEAGIGKTRVAVEFTKKVRRFPDFDSVILYTRARRYRNAEFGVVKDVLINYLGVDMTDTEQIVKIVTEKLDVEESNARDFAGMMRNGSTGQVASRSFVLMYAVVKCIMKKYERSPYPVLLFIDDVQHIDPQSRDFFEFYLKNADLKPFFLFTERSSVTELDRVFSGLRQIALSSLSEQESFALIEALHPAPFEPGICDRIIKSSSGNPLFIKEFVRYAESNALSMTPTTTTAPTTIQTIFLTSIDAYEPEIRGLLKKLSVFIHSFTLENAVRLHEATDGDPRVVESAISFFLREGILIQDRDSFMFKHSLFKRALYDSLLNYNKKVLHRMIAASMTEWNSSETPRLLHHLLRAEEYDDARKMLLDAPDCSVNPEYVYHIDVLLGTTPKTDTDTIIELLFTKSAILFNNGNTDETDEILKRILRLAITGRNLTYSAKAHHILTAYNMKAGAYEKGLLCGKKALEQYSMIAGASAGTSDGESPHARVGVMRLITGIKIAQNDYDGARELFAALHDLPPSSETGLAIAEADYYLRTGEYSRVIEKLDQVIPSIESKNHDYWLAIRSMRAAALWYLCDFSSLVQDAGAILESEIKHHTFLSQGLAHMAVACRRLEDQPRSDTLLQQAEFYFFQIKNDFDTIESGAELAQSFFLCGLREKAESIAEDVLSAALRHSCFLPTFQLLVLLVEINVLKKRDDAARHFLAEARSYVEFGVHLNNRDLILYWYFRARLVPDECGSMERAIQLLEEELKRVPEQNVPVFLAMRAFSKVAAERRHA